MNYISNNFSQKGNPLKIQGFYNQKSMHIQNTNRLLQQTRLTIKNIQTAVLYFPHVEFLINSRHLPMRR